MVQTQFFDRSSDNLDEYKEGFLHGLKKAQIIKIFSDEVIIFLSTWVKNQTSYIPREDVDNLSSHISMIYKNENFYKFVIQQLEEVPKSDKIIEYSFNCISKLDESAKNFSKSENKRIFLKKLEEDKISSKKDDQDEMEKLLKTL